MWPDPRQPGTPSYCGPTPGKPGKHRQRPPATARHRTLACKNGMVTFSYRNRKKGIMENETVEAAEFIRRFLLHVVPKSFMRIRHYGLFANRSKKKNITRCRKLLGVKEDLPKRERKSVEELMLELTGKNIRLCPFCKKGTLKQTALIPRDIGTGVSEIINRVNREDSS
ncbi:MAG: transposase [Desulfobacterales bacterium]|nr:transposase [Desulfobacterales bacterium]